MEDEFVILPDYLHHSSARIGIGYLGSHDPDCNNVSGRQHRPIRPEHALRYSEEGDFICLGSVREVYPSKGNGSSAKGDQPSGIGDTLDKVITRFTGSGEGQDILHTTLPGNTSMLGEYSGKAAKSSGFWKLIVPTLRTSRDKSESKSLAGRSPRVVQYSFSSYDSLNIYSDCLTFHFRLCLLICNKSNKFST